MAEPVAHYVHRGPELRPGQQVEGLCGKEFVLTLLEPVGKTLCRACHDALAAWPQAPAAWRNLGVARIDLTRKPTLEDYALPA